MTVTSTSKDIFYKTNPTLGPTFTKIFVLVAGIDGVFYEGAGGQRQIRKANAKKTLFNWASQRAEIVGGQCTLRFKDCIFAFFFPFRLNNLLNPCYPPLDSACAVSRSLCLESQPIYSPPQVLVLCPCTYCKFVAIGMGLMDVQNPSFFGGPPTNHSCPVLN